MKRIVVLAAFAGLIGIHGTALAGDTTTVAGLAVTQHRSGPERAESLTLSQTFAGMVKKTDHGMILATGERIYRLRGLSLEAFAGKQAYVTGMLRTEKGGMTIYVLRADLQ